MRACDIVADLTRRGIRLEARGDKLRYFPRSALTPALLDLLRANRDSVLALVEAERVTRALGADPRDGEFFTNAAGRIVGWCRTTDSPESEGLPSCKKGNHA